MTQDPSNLGVTAGIDAGNAADILAQRIAAINQQGTASPMGTGGSGAAIDTEEALDRILAENAAAANLSPLAAAADLRSINNSALNQARGEYAQMGFGDQVTSNSPLFRQYAEQRQQEARYRAGYTDTPELSSPSFSEPLGSVSDFDSARHLDNMVLDQARNHYTELGMYDHIGTPMFKDYVRQEQQQARYEQGYAESPDVHTPGHKESLKDILTSMDMAYGVGYGFMGTASAETKAFSPLVSGESYLPGQVTEQALTGVAPLLGAVGGTLIGAKVGGAAGSMAGQYIGQSIGQTAEDLIDQYTTGHTFTQERAGEALGVGRGGKEAGDEFARVLSEIVTPAAKELAEVFQRLGQTGPVSSSGVAGIAGFQYDFGTAFVPTVAAEDRFLSASPFRADMRQKFGTDAASISTADFLGEAGIAAFSDDYSGMMANLGFAQAKAGKDVENPAWRRDKEFQDRYNKTAGPWQDIKDFLTWDGGQGAALAASRERTGNVGGGGDYVPGAEEEPQYLSRQDKEAAKRSADSAKVYQDAFEQHQHDEADVRLYGAKDENDAARLQISLLGGGGAAAYRTASPGINADLSRSESAITKDIAGLRALEKLSPGQSAEYETLINQAAKQRDTLEIQSAALKKSAFDTTLGEEEAGFGLGMTRGTLSGASAASQSGGYNRQAEFLLGIVADPRNPLSPTERAGIEDNALRMRYTAANAVYDEENRDIARGRAVRDADVTQREFLGSPGDVYAASIRALDSDRDQLRQNASERTRGNLTFAQRQGLDMQDVGLQSDLLVGPERARRSYYGAESELLGAAQSGDRAGLSRDVGLYGNSAFGLHNVFQDDQQKVDNDFRDLSTSPNGSVAQKQAYARWRGDLQEQTENRDSSLLYRQTQSKRVHDFQDEGSFRRSLIAPYMDGPDSNPLTRGNAVLGDLRRDLSGAQAALKATPQTSPAYEANAQRVEDFQNRIAELEHSRYSEMFSALPESIAGAPGSGIMAGIVPTAAMTARFTSNPIFGGFGAPAPMPVSSTGAIHPGGTAGAFQTGSGAGSIEALLTRIATAIERGGTHTAAPWAGAGAAAAAQQRTYNPARPPF